MINTKDPMMISLLTHRLTNQPTVFTMWSWIVHEGSSMEDASYVNWIHIVKEQPFDFYGGPEDYTRRFVFSWKQFFYYISKREIVKQTFFLNKAN